MAKAFAERVLEVPWLMHLDVCRDELLPVFEGQSHPDLVGQTAGGDWIVVEAKGRSNSFGERLMEGYYRPFRTWLSRSQRTTGFGGRIFRIAEADNADFTVGLAENQLEQGLAGISEPEHHVRNENYYVGRDGVLVMLGSMWSPKNMRLEPQSRTRS